MISFKEFLLQEAALVIGDPSRSATKQFNNALILAGGAGSGKGFALGKIIDFQGKTFDVDRLKELYIKVSKKDKERFYNDVKELLPKIRDKKGYENTFKDFKKESLYPDELDLKNPAHVAILHELIKSKGLDDKQRDVFLNNLTANSENRPNVIFDNTSKSIKKLLNKNI